MIVISNSLPKSGSAYLFHMINEMIAENGGYNICNLKKEYSEELSFLLGENCNIQNITKEKLEKLIKINKTSTKTFAIKSHYYLNNNCIPIYENNSFKTIYIYRDPRDAILSAIDHGNKLMERNNLEGYFTRYTNVFDSTKHIKKWLDIYISWKKYGKNIYFVMYENLVNDPLLILLDIQKFLGFKLSNKKIKEIILNNTPDNAKCKNLHYNKGLVNRYKHEMNQKEIFHCNKELEFYILEMGYTL